MTAYDYATALGQSMPGVLDFAQRMRQVCETYAQRARRVADDHVTYGADLCSTAFSWRCQTMTYISNL